MRPKTEGPLTATTSVSLDENGPYEPLGAAVFSDGAVRDMLAKEHAVPSAKGRLRLIVLALALLPAFGLAFDHGGGWWAVLIWIGWELSRKTPRLSGVTGVAIAAVLVRWSLVAARYCGYPKPIVWVAIGVVAVSLVLLARTPTPRRIALEIFGKLEISRSAALASIPNPAFARTSLAFGIAIGFPLAMWATRRSAFDDALRVAIIVAFFAVTFFVFQTPLQKQPRRLALGLLAGFSLVAAMTLGLQAFFDVGTAVASCTKKLEHADETLLWREADAARSMVRAIRSSTLATVFAVLIVPIAEERIFRDVPQRAPISRYGRLYALFVSAVASGLTAIGPLPLLPWQGVALGLACGIAWLEGGIIASTIVHIAWNVLLLQLQ